ncbi:hypothetical protein DFH09DRAFT_659116 [Mycena vulgaris]|nr:hypothetical protein DFH09DRAFT_659116 [Mycena vulgaris]
MDTISPAEELELFQLISDAQTTNYLAAAALTVLLLEHISTFKQEVKFVWQSRLSLWSVLYVWVRYVTLLVSCVDVAFMFRQMESSSVSAFFSVYKTYLSGRSLRCSGKHWQYLAEVPR